MSVTVRLAATADRPAVELTVRAAYAQYVPRIGREPGPMLSDYGMLIRKGCVHVVGVGAAIQGVLVLIREPAGLLLDNVAVAPAFQGLGLGRALLDFGERTAAAAGYPSIRLYTHEAMTENIALYRRRGYCETHRGEENGFRRVYLSKALG